MVPRFNIVLTRVPAAVQQDSVAPKTLRFADLVLRCVPRSHDRLTRAAVTPGQSFEHCSGPLSEFGRDPGPLGGNVCLLPALGEYFIDASTSEGPLALQLLREPRPALQTLGLGLNHRTIPQAQNCQAGLAKS